MATYHGKDGSFKAGANTVGEVRSFSVAEVGETADDTVMGDAARTHKSGITSFSGSLTGIYTIDDAGQEAMKINDSVALTLYPGGATTSYAELTGTATITGRSVESQFEDMVTISIEFTGNGALTHGTVT